MRLQNLANFFDVTVEFIRRDNRPPLQSDALTSQPFSGETAHSGNTHYVASDLTLLPGAPSVPVNDVIWNCHKVFSGYTDDGDQVLFECKIKLVRKSRGQSS